jgi:DNA-binding MarR family transcriptional regulator
MAAEYKPARLPPPLIGALLRWPWEAVRGRMIERLHAQGFDDLTPPHVNVLHWPGPDRTRPSELAARLRMSRQALNYLLGDLERLGYLERRPDPDDHRGRRIYLTDRGREATRIMRGAARSVEREWERKLGQAEFAELRKLLLQLDETPE